QAVDTGGVLVGRLNHLGVGAEPGDLPGHPDVPGPQRVAERLAGVAAHDQVAAMRHEPGQVPDRALDDQRATLHVRGGARAGVAGDDDRAAAHRGAGAERAGAADLDPAGAHRLTEAPAGAALDHDLGAVVEAAAVVADRPGEADRARPVLADAEVVA